MFRIVFIWLLVLRTLTIFSQSHENKILVLQGHSDVVLQEKFSHDGSKIVTSSMDGTVKVWDVKTGKLLFDFELIKKNANLGDRLTMIGKSATYAVFSPDDKFVLSTCFDGTIRVWELITGEEKWKIIISNIASYSDLPEFAIISNDSKRIAVVIPNGTILIINFISGEIVGKIKAHKHLTSIQFNPEGNKILSYDDEVDHCAKLWDVLTGKLLFQLEEGKTNVRKAIFSPDGSNIATLDYDNEIRIWNPDNGLLINEIHGEELSQDMEYKSMCTIEYTPDGSGIVATDKGIIVIYNSRSGTEIIKLGSHLVKHPNSVITEKKLITNFSFDNSGERMVSVGYDGYAHVWNLKDRVEMCRFKVGSLVYAVISPDGSKISSSLPGNDAAIFHVFYDESLDRTIEFDENVNGGSGKKNE